MTAIHSALRQTVEDTPLTATTLESQLESLCRAGRIDKIARLPQLHLYL